MEARLLVVLALAAVVVVVALIVRARARRRAAALVGTALPDDLRARLSGPGVVYFYGPACGPCEQQARELEALDPAVPVVRVDATREPKLADALGVAAGPAAAGVDRAGRVRALNLGYYPRATLNDQLAEVS